jgi:hypothetical protein
VSQISLLRYPLTLPPPSAPQTSLHDLCVPSAGTGGTTDVKNVPCRFAVSIAEVFTMKRDANDVSFERITLSVRTFRRFQYLAEPLFSSLAVVFLRRSPSLFCSVADMKNVLYALGNSSLPDIFLLGSTHTLCDSRLVCDSTPVSAVLVVFSILWLMFHISLYVRGVYTVERNYITNRGRIRDDIRRVLYFL